ncbi:derlin-2 [Thecamonas trahens ATCC 50062]|uniref:Derlin n=1 Tax=Thecamonas trahens ATCC 50062 TaxID=461836 RepID=A0A0L0DTQ5_THETB|nr:derlin-2 [Thecamonas trahens ATCC 50062]KNC55630.1 derlin-2 [Thecamonas trahens ATCC 50062]|eukprot:XP_013761400.1 derlin-2 [Thecamonas trahens ATCC 50062]
MAAVQEMYRNIPPVTRTWATLAAVTTGAAQLGMISPFTLYFNWNLIMRGEVWRLITPFVYFASAGPLDMLLHLYFLIRYCRTLEEFHYAGRVADMLYMILFGAVCMIAAAPFLGLLFLGDSLSFMTVYVWARRNEHVHMNLFGLMPFTAPYLPWILLAFSFVMGHSPIPDLVGIVVGHLYYYFVDIYPATSGRHLLATPHFLRVLCGDIRAQPPAPAPVAGNNPDAPPARPGGFAFGADE